MDLEFQKLVQAAAPRPSSRLDVEAMWERAGRQRVARRLVAASFVMVLAATAWWIAQGGHVSELLEDRSVGPAGQENGNDASTKTTQDAPRGKLYLENLCGNIGDCSLTIIDLDAGTARILALPELALGDSQFRIVRSGRKLVFRGSTSQSTGSDVAAFALDLDLEEPPQNIGESWYLVPSATEGRIWLAILDPESPGSERALEGVREVTVEGEVTVPDIPLPVGRWSTLVGAAQEALVFQGDEGLEVWDPFKRNVVMRLPGSFLADAHGSVIAWCDVGCKEFNITDVTTSESLVVPPGEGFSFIETNYGAFSPDGSLLAVPVVTDATGRTQLALVDVDQGTASVIKGSELDSAYGSITWSSSGNWIFFNAGNHKVMTYQTGSAEAEVLPVEIERPFFGVTAS